MSLKKEHHQYLGPNPRGSDLICLSWDLNVNISKAAYEILMVMVENQFPRGCKWVLNPWLQPSHCHIYFQSENLHLHFVKAACSGEERIEHDVKRCRFWLWVCSLRALDLNFHIRKMLSFNYIPKTPSKLDIPWLLASGS